MDIKKQPNGAGAFLPTTRSTRVWMVAGVMAVSLLSAVLSGVYTSQQPKLYRSTASLLVEQFSGSGDEKFKVGSEVARAYVNLAESKPVKDAAAQMAHYALNEAEGLPVAQRTVRNDGLLIYFDVLDGDSKRAAMFANTWANALVNATMLHLAIPKPAGADAKDREEVPRVLVWETAVEAPTPSLPNWVFNVSVSFLGAMLLSVVAVALGVILGRAWNNRGRIQVTNG
ncbi:MAG: hypothetical protein WCT04_13570 [Planctomycetota bacterium]